MQHIYKGIGILLILFIQTRHIDAQQLPIYSQYTFNKFLLNPATAGSDGYTTISLVAREQWLGFKGTPKTHAVTIDSRLLRNSFISKNASVRKKKRLSSRSGRVGWAAHVLMIIMDHGSLWEEGLYLTILQLTRVSSPLDLDSHQFKLNKDKVDLGDDFQSIIESRHNLFRMQILAYIIPFNIYGGASGVQIFNLPFTL
jgi:hypothetical protein